MPQEKKIKTAFVSLTSCEGCQFAVLDLGKHFLGLTKRIEIAKFRLIEEKDKYPVYFDIAFIEGSPLLKDNITKLKELRRRTKFLVIMGNCAHTGGVYALRNYMGRERAVKHVYPKTWRTVYNPIVPALGQLVKVDYLIPGCPITGKEFLHCAYDLLADKPFQIIERPVCYECQLNNVDCLLRRGLPCLGPVIIGGCGAVCPKAGMPCQACRGPLRDPSWANLLKLLKNILTPKQINEILEIFNIKPEIINLKR